MTRERRQPKIALLDDELHFPPVSAAHDGLLAVGGDLSAARLILAYESGIFPWSGEDTPLLWWAPEERSVLPLDKIRIHKSMRNVLNRNNFEIRMDTAFGEVIERCARHGRPETWITQEFIDGYRGLHELGMAHSIEAWENGQLVGGLYGVSAGQMFFGESMFSAAPNASKAALLGLVRLLKAWGFGPIDCQIQNPHLATLGAEEIDRDKFMSELAYHLHAGPTRLGSWSGFEVPPWNG